MRVAAFIPPAGAPELLAWVSERASEENRILILLEDTDPHALVNRNAVLDVEAGCRTEGMEAVLELGVTKAASEVELLTRDRLGNCLGLGEKKRQLRDVGEGEKRSTRTWATDSMRGARVILFSFVPMT